MAPQLSENVEVWRVRSSRSGATVDPKGQFRRGKVHERVNGLHLPREAPVAGTPVGSSVQAVAPDLCHLDEKDTARRTLFLDNP